MWLEEGCEAWGILIDAGGTHRRGEEGGRREEVPVFTDMMIHAVKL